MLMAVCDAHNVFTLVNIGDFGSKNDSFILVNSSMGKALENNTLGIPTPETFEGLQAEIFQKIREFFIINLQGHA